MISFARISTKSAYDALTPVQDRLYFIDETGELFMNGKPYNGDDGSRDWLCFSANEANSSVQVNRTRNPVAVDLEYSTDGMAWTTYTWSGDSGTVITLTNAGDKVYFRGDNPNVPFNQYDTDSRGYKFAMSGSINASGNIMSLVDKTCQRMDVPTELCFANLFENCTAMKTAPRLPATKLKKQCYLALFAGTGITQAPELPCADLYGLEQVYAYMFQNCQALLTPPSILPAPIVPKQGYQRMFYGCYNLASTPLLPAIAVGEQCYYEMFRNCIRMSKGVETLPATTLAKECYRSMFQFCSALSKPPALPAGGLAEGCYQDMFKGSGLTEVPSLQGWSVQKMCYAGMFSNCGKLENIPTTGFLNSTSLAEGCYSYMFEYCPNLKSGCQLPATTLVKDCYAYMYQGCTSMKDSENIKATTLATGAMKYMFSNCTKLCRIKIPNMTAWDTTCTENWMNGLAGLRRAFVCNANLDTESERSTSKLPNGWIATRSSYGGDAIVDMWSMGSQTSFTFSPCKAENDLFNVGDNGLELSAITPPSNGVGTAQAFIKWDSTSNGTVTAGTGLTFVDTPRKGYMSQVIVTWEPYASNASLRVMWETAI